MDTAVLDPATLAAENEMLRRRVCELEGQVAELNRKLEDRKVIERAKGLIMESRGLPEKVAYRVLRTASQKNNVSMARLAKIVILAHQARPGRGVPARRRVSGG